MTRKEAVKAFEKISKKLSRLHSSAANHISRRDNNWVFEQIYKFQHVADRIRTKYENAGDYKGGGPDAT